MSALKKLALDYAGRALRRQRICIQVADKLCTDTSCFGNPCGNHSFQLDKDPFNVDTDNWAQLTLSCLLNVVKEKGGINRFLDSIDDESQKKLIEKLISEGEDSLIDMLDKAKTRNKYTLNFSCDTQTTVVYMLQISTVIQLEGEEHPIEIPLNLDPEQARCHKAPGIPCSAFIEDLCCSCKNLPRKP